MHRFIKVTTLQHTSSHRILGITGHHQRVHNHTNSCLNADAKNSSLGNIYAADRFVY